MILKWPVKRLHLALPRTPRRNSPTKCAIEFLEKRVLPAITITVDYTRDTNNFFSPETNRRAVLEAAINSVATNLNDTLTEIVPRKNSNIDTWTAAFTNPTTGSDESIVDLIVGEDEIIVFVGARQLGSSTLGIGGFGGATTISGTQAWLDQVVGRGNSGTLQSPETDFSPWGGSLAFDIDTNWYFGIDTTGLDSNESDFYSVAVHEFVHLLGFGTAPAWDNLISGGRFTGAVSSAEYDESGDPPVSGDTGHWADGTTDEGFDTAMDPSILQGTRKTMTRLDYAGLDDIGWTIAPGAGGGGGGTTPNRIELADGAPHVLTISDDGIPNNGMSVYTIDGGIPVTFETAGNNVTVAGGNMADTINVTAIDSGFTGTLFITSGDGNDTVNYIHTLAGDIQFDGGIGSDTLSVSGSSVNSVDYNFNAPFGGNLSLSSGTTTNIPFLQTETLIDAVSAANRVINLGTGADTITIGDDGTAANGRSRTTAPSTFPSLTFANPTSLLTLNTGLGNDITTINQLDFGFTANISVNSGDGNDQVIASLSTRPTTIDGGNGNDTLTGSAFADLMLGNSGTDSINGQGGNDNLLGGSGADTLNGGDGDDILSGQSGDNDLLSGGNGNDTLNGGDGIDQLFESGNANFILTINTLTGLGVDSLAAIEQAIIVGGIGNNLIDASLGGRSVTVFGGSGNDTLIGSTLGDYLSGQSGNDSITSGDGADTILGGDGNDSISALAGSDSVDSGNGNDSVLGGDGNDTLRGNTGSDTILGGTGNDVLLGGDDADRLFGEDGNDEVNGENGDDAQLSGGIGQDTIQGGAGIDTVFESSDENFTLSPTSLVGDFSDTLVSIENASLTGGISNNVINTSAFAGSVTVFGGAGNDTITTGSSPDVISGDDGNDLINGGSGNDSILGGSGADTLNGLDGNDTLQGQGGSLDSLVGGNGDDLVDGGSGNDKLFGNDGSDTLVGGEGADFLLGGNSNDSLLGGIGDDTLFGEAGNDLLNGGAGNDQLDGGDGDDGLSGFTGNDNLIGGFGRDTLFGGDGADILIGAADSDTCIGQAGADTINGNGGFDRLVGGSGLGTADVGDTITATTDEIDETFSINPLPDWVNRV